MKYRIWNKVAKEYMIKRHYINQNGKVVIEDKGGMAITINQKNYIVELSTERLDMSGKEIYQGDKIKYNTIEFDGLCFSVSGDRPLDMYDSRLLEVVGTIHDEE